MVYLLTVHDPFVAVPILYQYTSCAVIVMHLFRASAC
jgi:hypothetical protein